MKIICAGFWKTGTKSLANALDRLGYKVYDYDYQCFELPDLWNKFIDGTVTDNDIRYALKDVDVIIDGPCIAYWEEIARAIPEAKVILTIRNEDKWWESYKGVLRKMPRFFKLCYLLMFLSPSARSLMRGMSRMSTLCMGVEGAFAIPFIQFDDNPRMYKNAFRKHNSHVLHSVPKENLLVYEPGDGWESLCKFLGKEIPDVPYPHKNKGGTHFTEDGGPQHPKFKRIMAEVFVILAILVALLSIAVYYLFSYVFY